MAEPLSQPRGAERASDTPPAPGAPPAGGTAGRRRRWRRRLLITLALQPLLVASLWVAVHTIPGFGPLLADGLRAVFGNASVAWLEDTAYGVQDWYNRKTRADTVLEALWTMPSQAPIQRSSASPVAASASQAEAPRPAGPPPFALPEVGPVFEKVAAEGDGVWLPLRDPRHPGDRVRMLKTALHPDRVRSWAVVAVVALDLHSVRLHLVAGRFEPESKTAEAKRYKRTAVVPEADRERLLAAFNGGYKSTHGDYGMRIDGVTLVPPRALACTIARYRDGRYAIAPWKKAKASLEQMEWFRQTPICMYDAGKPHPALSMPSIGWGASAVSKTTVIRRSALGISEEGQVLYVGIGNFVTGQTIGRAMRHAGAHSVAQLDVNFSFPKFVTYAFKEPGSQALRAVPLTKNFEFTQDQYIGTRSHRDFFYVTRR